MTKRRLSKRTKLKIALALFLCIFVCALCYLGYVFYDYFAQRRIESKIGDLFDEGLQERDRQQGIETPTPTPDPEDPPEDDEPPESAWNMERRLLLEEEERGRIFFADILEINEDFLGMIEIPGLIPRQPYVQYMNNRKYLNTDFNGNRNQNGTVFLNSVNDRLLMDNNSVMFGHHTTVGSMFARLVQYKNADTFKKAPVIVLDGLIGESVWIIFAAHVTEPIPWYTNVYYEREEYAEHLEEILARSLFITDVDVTPDDRILTLSVCDYTYEDMRFIVHARRLRPDEKIPEEVIAETNPNIKPYTIPHQQPLREVDMTNTTVTLNPARQNFFIYQARAGGIDRFSGDQSLIQGPFRSLSHNGVTANTFIAAVVINLREEEENEDARGSYVAVQGLGGGTGITLFSSTVTRSGLTEIGVVTPAGVDARFPAIINHHGNLWLLYSVDDGTNSNIYRQPLLGGDSEHLVTVRGVVNARPLGFYYVGEQWVVVWHEPSSGGIHGARFGTREVFQVATVGAYARVSTYSALSGTSVRIAIEIGGKLSFTSIDLSQTPTGEPVEPVEPTPPPEWYIPPEWLNPR
ncbi:MAG: class B sortase [Oscillospiraceae bacterium]|nr:class B sortase [Oscillospiraceae bacterium]